MQVTDHGPFIMSKYDGSDYQYPEGAQWGGRWVQSEGDSFTRSKTFSFLHLSLQSPLINFIKYFQFRTLIFRSIELWGELLNNALHNSGKFLKKIVDVSATR
jgi:hypothetical protein